MEKLTDIPGVERVDGKVYVEGKLVKDNDWFAKAKYHWVFGELFERNEPTVADLEEILMNMNLHNQHYTKQEFSMVEADLKKRKKLSTP